MQSNTHRLELSSSAFQSENRQKAAKRAELKLELETLAWGPGAPCGLSRASANPSPLRTPPACTSFQPHANPLQGLSLEFLLNVYVSLPLLSGLFHIGAIYHLE